MNIPLFIVGIVSLYYSWNYQSMKCSPMYIIVQLRYSDIPQCIIL